MTIRRSVTTGRRVLRSSDPAAEAAPGRGGGWFHRIEFRPSSSPHAPRRRDHRPRQAHLRGEPRQPGRARRTARVSLRPWRHLRREAGRLARCGDGRNRELRGTAVLCEAARKHGHEVFLLISTDEVYGDVREGRSTETDPLKPRSPYSASKAGGEHIAQAYAESFGLPLLVTRGSNNYGPHQYPEKLIPVLITNAIDDRPLPLYNDGSAVRDYVFVEDHCRAIDEILFDAPIGAVYNVGTGAETTGLQVAEAVLDIMGKPKSLIEFVADRPGHDYRYALDISRITALGWEPQVELGEGLERTVRWYVDHPDWWRPLKSGEYWEYYRRNYRPLVT